MGEGDDDNDMTKEHGDFGNDDHDMIMIRTKLMMIYWFKTSKLSHVSSYFLYQEHTLQCSDYIGQGT